VAAPKLTPALKQQLDAIEPSHYDPQIALHPCSVQLRDGRTLECVYMTEASVFKCLWHFDSPEEVPGMFCISPAEVVSITDSPFRLPARFANKVYQAGESGMGYTIFALKFKWWPRRYYCAGSFVDFVEFPPWQGPDTVTCVLTHLFKRFKRPQKLPNFSMYDCVYSD
jgi:hypothetical protein